MLVVGFLEEALREVSKFADALRVDWGSWKDLGQNCTWRQLIRRHFGTKPRCEKEWTSCLKTQRPVGPFLPEHEGFGKLNGQLKKVIVRFTPHFVLTYKFEDNRKTISVFREIWSVDWLNTTPYCGPLRNRLYQLLGGNFIFQVPGGHHGRSADAITQTFSKRVFTNKQHQFPCKRRGVRKPHTLTR